MTIHKSQGSQADEVTVLMPTEDSRLLSRELFYTVVTRAKAKVRLVGSAAAVRAAIGRRCGASKGSATAAAVVPVSAIPLQEGHRSINSALDVNRSPEIGHEPGSRRRILGHRLGRTEPARPPQDVFRHRFHQLTAERKQVLGQLDQPVL
jgi:UvrD-like helicase C-terminal domain